MAGGAPVTQHVTDGGFESTSCPDTTPANCTNASWTKDTPSPQRQNYFCAGDKVCEGSPASGGAWLRLGGSNIPNSGTAIGIVSQSVLIPATPATLTYKVKFTPNPGDTSSALLVNVDGLTVRMHPSTGTSATYAVQSVDVSKYAKAGTHNLSFNLICQGSTGLCGVFDVDDVALTTGGPSAACLKATAKLKKAKAKLKKLKQDGASQQAIAKQQAKVKKKKAAKKKACA